MSFNKKLKSKDLKYKSKKVIRSIKDASKLNLSPDTLYFLPLGGTGEFGNNINLYCYNNKWIIVDVGITFDNNNMRLIMPDIEFIRSIPKEDVLGIFITHAHYDHLGGLPHLWQYMPYPAYMTPFTARFFQKQIVDLKAKYYNTLYETKYGETIDLGEFKIVYRNTPHSIPDSAMIIIKTKSGSLLHTGDWRSEENPIIGDGDDTKLIQEATKDKFLAIVGDSTNAMTIDTIPSELEVQQSLRNRVMQVKNGRIVIVCFSTHVARIMSAAQIAKEINRNIVLVGRSLRRMKEVSDDFGYFSHMNHFVTEDASMEIDPNDLLIICTGSQGEDWSGLKRLSENEHPKIKLSAGDTVIVSARMIVGRERQIYDMINRFVAMGVHVITSETDKSIHASGHPTQNDLKALYNLVKPKFVIPVHGEYRHLKAHADTAKSIGLQSYIPANGELIEISEHSCKKVNNIHYAKVILDGNIIIPKDGQTVSERMSLSNGCLIVFIMIYNNDAQPKALKSVRFFGVCHPKEVAFKNKIRHKLDELINRALHSQVHENLQKTLGQKIRSEVQKMIFRDRGTDPQIFISILSEYLPSEDHENQTTDESLIL